MMVVNKQKNNDLRDRAAEDFNVKVVAKQ